MEKIDAKSDSEFNLENAPSDEDLPLMNSCPIKNVRILYN